MRRTIAAAALLLTLVGCGLGSKDDDSAADSPAAAKQAENLTTTVGKPLTVQMVSGGSAEVTVHKVTTSKKGKGALAEKPENGQFVVVDVQIKVTASGFPVNPLYVQYQDANEKVYDYGDGNALIAGFTPLLDSGDVPKGDSTRGVVVFDTPTGKGKQIRLTDELGDPIAYWTI